MAYNSIPHTACYDTWSPNFPACTSYWTTRSPSGQSAANNVLLSLDDQDIQLLEHVLEYTDTHVLTAEPQHPQYTGDLDQHYRGFNDHLQQRQQMAENELSRYAMDEIFKKLIYPDVCQGHFFTLETLVQNVPQKMTHDQNRKFSQPCQTTTKRAGKRKRPRDTSRVGFGKKRKCDVTVKNDTHVLTR